MKAKFFALFALMMCIASINESTAQQCNVNQEFAEYCGTQITFNDGSPSFSDDCVNGWLRSHGSPQILPGSPPYKNVAFMWAHGYNGTRCKGEGIYAPYNFQPGLSYKITIQYKAGFRNPTGSLPHGEVRLVAAQNIDRPNRWEVTNLLPVSAEREQRIATMVEPNSPWKSASFIFTPNNSYNQFWIHPFTLSGSKQYDLYVDWVTVCLEDCSTDMIYSSNGTLPIAPTTKRNVFIGTSFRPFANGVVTVEPTSQTLITAANSIVMRREFRASVTTGSFTARIQACSPSQTAREMDGTDTVDVSQFPFTDSAYITDSTYGNEFGGEPSRIVSSVELEELSLKSTEGVRLYPNPAQDKLYLQLDIKGNQKIRVKILNSTGSVASDYGDKFFNGNVVVLQIERLSPGVYFIHCENNIGKPTVIKFVKTM